VKRRNAMGIKRICLSQIIVKNARRKAVKDTIAGIQIK